ncbi:YhcN/YlaJ family sporulation lipoprotein [Brevibacillus daliensis]|uniref:YhcN/YlaJ family sporulation lipoprotein n=1 Tax=Brevibacillus daliensis TaxID=2892995 RepID=UPI001E3E2D5F|nr:YhcN/YlaJ family sporulation lipoprotein [Brevibacillus daliensis]
MNKIFPVLACCLVLTACTNTPSAQKPSPTQNQSNAQGTVSKSAQKQMGAHPQAPRTQRVEQTQPTPIQYQDSQAKSQHLVHLAKSVKNVKNATAVVLGDYAIVAIDVDDKLDRPEVGVIKYSVAEALKADPQGARAMVTADADIRQRVVEVQEDMRKGRGFAGIMEELADITGRLMPQLPKDVQERKHPQGAPGQQTQRTKSLPGQPTQQSTPMKGHFDRFMNGHSK